MQPNRKVVFVDFLLAMIGSWMEELHERLSSWIALALDLGASISTSSDSIIRRRLRAYLFSLAFSSFLHGPWSDSLPQAAHMFRLLRTRVQAFEDTPEFRSRLGHIVHLGLLCLWLLSTTLRAAKVGFASSPRLTTFLLVPGILVFTTSSRACP